MSNPWFRMYHEFATDPKVQMLSESDQRRYVMLLCLRCCNGDVTLHDTEVAFQLRITAEEWIATKSILVSKELIGKDNKPTSWNKRQYLSDSSAARVRAHREKKKRPCNVTETKSNALDTDTDTDTDTEKEKETSNNSPSSVSHGTGKDFDFSWWPHLPSPQIFKDWQAMRKGKKAPVSQTVINRYGKQLQLANEAGYSVDDCLSLSTTKGWLDFKFQWLLNEEKNNGGAIRENHSRNHQTAAERTNAALDAVFGPEPRKPIEGHFEKVIPLEIDRDTNGRTVDLLAGCAG